MKQIKGFKCFQCKTEYPWKDIFYNCEKCGNNVEVIYDYDYLKKNNNRKSLENNKDFSVWRYNCFYPIEDFSHIPPLQIGWTPLYRANRLEEHFDHQGIFIKDDGRNPSASFKDRAGCITALRAHESGHSLLTGASTGNAASSLSCIAASLGMKTIIFVPKTAPQAKITQLLVFGANVIMVDGTYDDAFELCLQATAKYGWYNRNTGYNPFTREGKKSCSYEICEQLNWKVPEWIFVSVGDGNIISGIWKGFKDLYKMGWIDKLPKLAACQASKSNAVYQAWAGDGEIRIVNATTLADSISVNLPRDGLAAVQAINESKGFAIEVEDELILDSIKLMASKSGVFAEPAGATCLAGFSKAIEEKKISSKESAVLVVTGNGLKDIQSVMKTIESPNLIKPDLRELERIIETDRMLATSIKHGAVIRK